MKERMREGRGLNERRAASILQEVYGEWGRWREIKILFASLSQKDPLQDLINFRGTLHELYERAENQPESFTDQRLVDVYLAHIPVIENFIRRASQTEYHLRDYFLDDLRRVGPLKPIGYLPLPALEGICRIRDIKALKSAFEKRGLKIKIFHDSDNRHVPLGGAFVVYDEEALQNLLSKYKDDLLKEHWPSEAYEFVEKIMREHAKPISPIYKIIGLAFADERFKKLPIGTR